MASLLDLLRAYIRATLGRDLKANLNRLRVRDPQTMLKDPERGPVLGSRGSAGGATTLVPEIPEPQFATFFGIPFSDAAPSGWGEPLEPPPGTPGGAHPERLWKLAQGAWTVATQLDWESTHPAGWRCGTMSWTSAAGITISWNWRPAGGHERSGACKYMAQVPEFVDWIAAEQAANRTLQSELYCNGRRVLEMPVLFLRAAGIIGAAILGDYLVIAAIDVYRYGLFGNDNPSSNRTFLGYWPIQPHADGGIEIVRYSSFTVVEEIEDYRWTQQWVWSEDGTLSACLANNHTSFGPLYEKAERTIWRGSWSLGPTPSVNVTTQVDSGWRRDSYKIVSSGMQTEDTCVYDTLPDEHTEVITEGPVFEVLCSFVGGPTTNYGLGASWTLDSRSNWARSTGSKIYSSQFAEEAGSDHIIAVDFVGNTESLAKSEFTCFSTFALTLTIDGERYEERDGSTTCAGIDPCMDTCSDCFTPGGYGEDEILYRESRVTGSVSGNLSMKLALTVNGQEKAMLGEAVESYSWSYDDSYYYRYREYYTPITGNPADNEAEVYEIDTGADLRKFLTRGVLSNRTLVEDTEIGSQERFCGDITINFPQNEGWSTSGNVPMERMKGRLIWMDIARDLYIVYEEKGDFYHFGGLFSGIDPWTDPIWQEPIGEATDDQITITRDGAVLEQPTGTPAPERRRLIDAKPLDASGSLTTGIEVNDFLALGNPDIGGARKGDAVLLAVLYDWRLVSDGQFRLTKLYSPDADPMTLVGATGADQFIGGIGRAE